MDISSHISRAVTSLGTDWTYTPVGGVARTVRASFHNAPIELMGIVDGTGPVLVVKSSDVTGAKSMDTWSDGVTTYTGQAPKWNKVSGTVEIRLEKV